MEEVTAAEHAAGQLGAEKLQRLARHFATTGFITLCNVVPDHGLLARLERGLDIAAAIQLLQKGPEDGWRTQRTCGPLLPRTAPWVDRSVVASPIIEHPVAWPAIAALPLCSPPRHCTVPVGRGEGAAIRFDGES